MNSKALLVVSVVLAAILCLAIQSLRRSAMPAKGAGRLLVYCAAGLKKPVEAALAEYKSYFQQTTGKEVIVEVQYGGSGTLLSSLQVARQGDLFIAADSSFTGTGRSLGVVREIIPLARMTPVVAVAAAAKSRIGSLEALLEGDWRIGIGTPDGTAVGTATRRAMQKRGGWEQFLEKVKVIKPTVNDLANDVQIGALDAAIVFDVVAAQYGLSYFRDPLLDAERDEVQIGVLASAGKPAAALHLARFLAAPEKGQKHFAANGFETVPGDAWADVPEVMFFSGGINKRAMEAVLAEFGAREGVQVNTVFQGCGGLTAQMRTIEGQAPENGFPDGYLACDIYYMDPVADWFSDKAAVSSTRMVIVTAKDNPHNIQKLEDLAKPGLRIVLGHPTHCTIGALSDRLLEKTGLLERVLPNIVERQPSSGMMVPAVVSGAADASIAYYTDTLPELAKLHVVEIENEYAKAVQPYGIANNSHYRQLMRRLYEHIGRSQQVYTDLGFGWELGRDLKAFEFTVPAGARRDK